MHNQLTVDCSTVKLGRHSPELSIAFDATLHGVQMRSIYSADIPVQ